MKRQLLKLWFVAVLAMVTFASCRKDVRTEPQDTPANSQGEPITLRLSVEVGFEEEQNDDLKGLSFKLEDVNGKKIPRPDLVDGQEVDVVTIIKNSNGTTFAKKMAWKYSAETKRLVLSRDNATNGIEIHNFNGDGDVKWYIAGLLVPTGECTLSGANNSIVRLTPTRSLKGVLLDQSLKDLGQINIPYWTGWMELLVESFPPNSRDGNASYSNAKVQTVDAKFKPLGSLIAFKLGNKLEQGVAPTFTPKGIVVSSNAYSDAGTFDFASSDVPSDNPQSGAPKWIGEEGSMVYTFATGYTASAINHHVVGSNLSRTYYAWVMPSETSPTEVKTRVMLRGEASGIATDDTKTYFTDYVPSGNLPKPGKIHSLIANATSRVIIPIEYVTEYNLAGGQGLLYKIVPPVPIGSWNSDEGYPWGDYLRFSVRSPKNDALPSESDAHRNGSSGYYNWYKVSGTYHEMYNNPVRDIATEQIIDMDGQVIPLASKYFVPEVDHLWGVFPAYRTSRSWSGSPYDESIDKDYFQLGYNKQQYFYGQSDYSTSFTDPLGGSDENDNAVIYAIRFAKAPEGATPETESHCFWNRERNAYQPRTYQPLMDNSLRCAYRYTRVRGLAHWEHGERGTQLKVDVVYIGDDSSVDLQEISNQDWWDSTEHSTSKRLQKGLGPVITRIFPASGKVLGEVSFAGRFLISQVGRVGAYWSSTMGDALNGRGVMVDAVDFGFAISYDLKTGLPVRLFKRNP